MIWKPRITVAAVVEQNGRFLMVEERIDGRCVLNQPAGHVEDGEDFVRAVVRETLEETGRMFEPEALLGIYLWRRAERDLSFLRIAFSGRIVAYEPNRTLDPDIVDVLWLSPAELEAQRARLRSPMVRCCVEDYRGGERYPLSLLKSLLNASR